MVRDTMHNVQPIIYTLLCCNTIPNYATGMTGTTPVLQVTVEMTHAPPVIDNTH